MEEDFQNVFTRRLSTNSILICILLPDHINLENIFVVLHFLYFSVMSSEEAKRTFLNPWRIVVFFALQELQNDVLKTSPANGFPQPTLLITISNPNWFFETNYFYTGRKRLISSIGYSMFGSKLYNDGMVWHS